MKLPEIKVLEVLIPPTSNLEGTWGAYVRVSIQGLEEDVMIVGSEDYVRKHVKGYTRTLETPIKETEPTGSQRPNGFGRLAPTESTLPIDKVTVQNLDIALRMCNIQIDKTLLDRIIDVVELIEEKGDDVSIKDVAKLKAEWKGDPSGEFDQAVKEFYYGYGIKRLV